MKEIQFNNIEENKFIFGYLHYVNNKNKVVYKKALGYDVPNENLIFCMSSHDFESNDIGIENIAYEKSEYNDKLYVSLNNGSVFEYKKHIYPKSDRKISMQELMELLPLLEKYMLDEDFDLIEDEIYTRESKPSLKKEAKKLMLQRVSKEILSI